MGAPCVWCTTGSATPCSCWQMAASSTAPLTATTAPSPSTTCPGTPCSMVASTTMADHQTGTILGMSSRTCAAPASSPTDPVPTSASRIRGALCVTIGPTALPLPAALLRCRRRHRARAPQLPCHLVMMGCSHLSGRRHRRLLLVRTARQVQQHRPSKPPGASSLPLVPHRGAQPHELGRLAAGGAAHHQRRRPTLVLALLPAHSSPGAIASVQPRPRARTRAHAATAAAATAAAAARRLQVPATATEGELQQRHGDHEQSRVRCRFCGTSVHAPGWRER
jgi:hypothetical protein